MLTSTILMCSVLYNREVNQFVINFSDEFENVSVAAPPMHYIDIYEY
jgi:hypothetical protein